MHLMFYFLLSRSLWISLPENEVHMNFAGNVAIKFFCFSRVRISTFATTTLALGCKGAYMIVSRAKDERDVLGKEMRHASLFELPVF
jgi:hypothetical protein